MIFAVLFVSALSERTKTCTAKQTLFDLTIDNFDLVIGKSRPVFVRIENEGCPYSKPSQQYWEEAANLFPNIKFVRAECLNNNEVCQKLGGKVSPTHILFGANNSEPLYTFTDSQSISISSTPYANAIYQHLGYYPIDTPSIQELIPESTHFFFETYKYPVFILYDSTCDEDSDFISNWLIEATENYITSPDYGFGKIDCYKYPDECANWGSTYPSANVFSRQKAISVSITEIDRLNERLEKAVTFLESTEKVYPTPAPYASPTTSPLPPLSAEKTVTLPDLENRDVSEIRSEYNAAKSASYEGDDYTGTPDVYGCSDVELRSEAIADVLKLLNFFRKLAGLPNNVQNDEQLNRGCYLAAKYSSRAGRLSHEINSYWKETCDFNSDGNWELISNSLANSNLAQGELRVLSMISGLIDDEGANNEDSVGHRRWFLYPYLEKIGVGFYPVSTHQMEGFSLSFPPSGAFNVNNQEYSDNGYTDLNFIAWPPAGPFPLERLPSSWSVYYNEFQKEGLSVDENIVIKLTRDDGIDLQISKKTLSNSNFGLSGTLIFKLTDDSLKLIKAGRSVHVQIYLLKDTTSDCLDYTVKFFDDNKEESVCFFNEDSSKCPENIDVSKRFGKDEYGNYRSTENTRTIIHVVEDLKLTSDLVLNFSPIVIIKGNKIEGRITVNSNVDLDIEDPSSTDFTVLFDASSLKCGVLRTPGKCKSLKVQITNEITTKTRKRLLVYFGSYVNIETPKKLRSGDFDYIFGISYDGKDAYFVCTPVLFVQYACEGGNRDEYNLDSSLNCFEFSESYTLRNLKTNRKTIKVYSASTSLKISASTIVDGNLIDYEFYLGRNAKPILEYSASLEFLAKTIRITSYIENSQITPSFAYPYLDEYINGLAYIHSKLSIYPFAGLYISNMNPSTELNGISVPDLVGDESAKQLLQRAETFVIDESLEPFADENGCYKYVHTDDVNKQKPLFITNGLHDEYNFTFISEHGQNNILRLRPTESSSSKPTTVIFTPKQTGGNWNEIFIENYKNLTIKTAVNPLYQDYDYFKRIYLQNVSRVRFIDLEGKQVTGVKTDITGSSNVDLSSTSDNKIGFSQLIVRSSPTIRAANTICNELDIVNSKPTIRSMQVSSLNIYDFARAKVLNCSVNGAVEFRVTAGSECPTLKVKNSAFDPSSIKLVFESREEDSYGSRILAFGDEPRLLLYGFDVKDADGYKSKIQFLDRKSTFFDGIVETANANYKAILSKDGKGVFVVDKDFDEENAPETVPEDEDDEEIDDDFEVLPPPPIEAANTTISESASESVSTPVSETESLSEVEIESSIVSQTFQPFVPTAEKPSFEHSNLFSESSFFSLPPPTAPPSPSYPPEIVDRVDVEEGASSTELDSILKSHFANYSGASSSVKVAVIDISRIAFDTELGDLEYIKASANATVDFRGGRLNLVPPDEGSVTVSLHSASDSLVTFRGAGEVELLPPENTTSSSIRLEGDRSLINGSLIFSVPESIDVIHLDTITLEKSSTVIARKTDEPESSVAIEVDTVKVVENARAVVRNLKVERSLLAVQSATVELQNVDMSGANISFDVSDFAAWRDPLLTGAFASLPGFFFVNNVATDVEKMPAAESENALMAGEFAEQEGNSCEDWLKVIRLDYVGFEASCVELVEQQLGERKRVVVRAAVEEKDAGKKLGAGAIAGIVIGCVAVMAIIVAVVVVLVRKRKGDAELSSIGEQEFDSDGL